jgi:hypothetical protein
LVALGVFVFPFQQTFASCQTIHALLQHFVGTEK